MKRNYKIFLAILSLIILSWKTQPRQRIYMIGDSTMANKKEIDFPETGWGQVWDTYFTDAVEIQNHAVNGRSTKSFRDRGHWKVVYDQLKKGDYVIIQFGHNDAKQDDSTRYAPAGTDYRNNLIRYIDEVKSKGAIPILCTPVYRRKWDDGNLIDTHGDYPMIVRQVAKEKSVDLIDLHEASKKIIESHGESSSSFLFMHYPGGVFSKFKEGIADNTHFTPYGANLIASAACRLLLQQRHPFLYFFKKSSFDQKYLFEMPQIAKPYFRKDTFDITNYGAKQGVSFVNTSAIQSAIDIASAKQGGVVLIPKGIWITGPIELKENVNLHISTGSLVQFSDNRDHYPIIETTWEGQLAYRCQAPISAKNKNNIAVTGGGTIDGAGQVWKSVKKSKLTASQWAFLIKNGGVYDADTWYPSESSRLGHGAEWAKKITAGKTLDDYKKVRDFLRPNMVSLNNCNLVMIEGVSFNNSPAWTLHPLLCNHITIQNVKVTNPWFGQNNDALDLESCHNGIVDHCVFDTGDDAITIKSGRDEEGRKRAVPTENIIIKNTTVYHGHGGFVIGSEMSGGVKNMFVSDCTFLGTDIGLRFKTTRGRGGMVSDIYATNIQMSEILGEAILFDMHYTAKDPIPLLGDKNETQEIKNEPFSETTPVFKNFYFNNIQCKGAATAIKINGIPESRVANVAINNSGFKSVKGISIQEANQIQLNNVEVHASQGAILDIVNSNSIFFNHLTYDLSLKNIGTVKGKTTDNIKFKNCGELKIGMLDIEEQVGAKVVVMK